MDPQLQRSPLLPLIRAQVKERLTASPAFNQLSKDTQRQIAYDTVNALHYILGGEDGTSQPQSMVLGGNSSAFAPSEALAGAATTIAPARSVRGIGQRTGGAPGAAPAGGGARGGINTRERKGFGEAADIGSNEFTEMIANVDFPAFVGGLIDGVFNSIVTTSIKQMEAYAEMVRNVSKSVDQYMKDNVTENHARDYLADRYPGHLQVDISGDKPRLKPREGHDEDNLPDFFKDLGLKAPVSSLDEDNVEQQLVPAARRRIAMDRQQMLATMVMMGVNRLVVTNGTIEASCMFELDTSDVRKRGQTRTTDFEHGRETTRDWGGEGSTESSRARSGKWSWSDDDEASASGDWSASDSRKNSWYSKGTSKDTAKFKMTTVSTRSDDNTINMHAQLGGKVKVNFKSDYFPMEKMIDALQVNQIREMTQAGIAPPVQRPAPPPPPLPAMPAIAAPPAVAPAPAGPAAPPARPAA